MCVVEGGVKKMKSYPIIRNQEITLKMQIKGEKVKAPGELLKDVNIVGIVEQKSGIGKETAILFCR